MAGGNYCKSFDFSFLFDFMLFPFYGPNGSWAEGKDNWGPLTSVPLVKWTCPH